jgi:hypothetical protein
MPTTQDASTHRPWSLRRRLIVFSGAVLAPVIAGAVVSGLLLLYAAVDANRLTDDVAAESNASLALFRDLQTARLDGSSYMEEGERTDLNQFRTVGRRIDRSFAEPVHDEAFERAHLRDARRHWEAAVAQLRSSRPGFESGQDDAVDAEDVFEARMNRAIADVERMVEDS